MGSTKAIVCFFVALFLLSGLRARQSAPPFSPSDSLPPRLSQFDGRTYALLTFREIPNQEQLNALHRQNIRLLQYLGDKSYLCSYPCATSPTKEDLITTRALIQPSDKWSGRQPVAEWENRRKPTTVLLRYYDDIPPGRILQLLQEQQIELKQAFELLPMVAVHLAPERLPALVQQPWVQYVQPLLDDPVPDDNLLPAPLAGANLISKPNGIPYTGHNVLVAVGDDGVVGPHIDFLARLKQSPELSLLTEGSHGDLVSGILAGAGNLLPKYRGIAPQANLLVLKEFETITQASELHELQQLMVTCTALSDGCNDQYDLRASLADRQLYQYPYLMHIFSAGNAGFEECGYGAGPGWGNITGGTKLAKNTITVGNTNADDLLAPSSSRGPAPDGRLKPDLCAPGQMIGSTLPDNEYGTLNGTSASAPVVTGIYAQLVEAFRIWSGGEDPPSALLKALLLNTAEDLGNPGPDFLYGFGRVNGRRAFQELKDEQYFQGAVSQNGQSTHFLEVPEGVEECRVLLYWHDREASPFATSALVNDLHLKIIGPDDTEHLPLVLNHQPQHELLIQPAQEGIDTINNAEQVVLNFPEPGTYQLEVKGAEITTGSQVFFLAYSFRKKELRLNYPKGGEALQADSTAYLHWEASPGSQPFQLSWSADGGNSWKVIGTASPDSRSFYWQAPNLSTARARIRVSRGNESDQSVKNFTIGQKPQGLALVKKCTEYARLRWNSLPGMEQYVVYRLGETTMDSVMTVSDTTADVPIASPLLDHWFAVSALIDSMGIGPRCRAIPAQSGLYDCAVGNDIGILSINSPGGGVRPDCFSEAVTVSFTFKNFGTLPQQGCCFFFQYDDLPPQQQCYEGIIPSGVPINLIMDSTLVTGSPGVHCLKIWAANPGDEVRQNDTLTRKVEVVQGEVFTLPYVQEFDDFPLCSSFAPCEQPCPLIDGWNNETKGDIDQIDWLVHAGPTPTAMTGPTNDQNNFSQHGRYLYLESSGSCSAKQAVLLSPCIDLGVSTQPVLSFWYHMYGESIGALYVDLYDGKEWILNINAPLLGNQGEQWKQAMVPLEAFAGKTVMLRFRGYAEEGFFGDLALDKFAVYDRAAPPIPAIFMQNAETCPGALVQFFDNSLNGPSSWHWSFDPPLAHFLDGDMPHSPNPVVSFSQAGRYAVTLTVSNSQGDTASTTATFLVSNGSSLPLRVDFEEPAHFLPEGWSILNPDNQITWKETQVIGKDGLPTQALLMDNHNYLKINEQDVIQSALIDLTNSKQPQLKFDLSYAMYNVNFLDRLLIKVSSECGQPLHEIVFDQSGSELVTIEKKYSGWTPTRAWHWGSRTVDLSAFAGRSVVLEFVNICGFGNNLYLDNIRITDEKKFPTLQLDWTPKQTAFCQGESLSFSIQTNESLLTEPLHWIFGAQAEPAEAFGPGPHQVFFPHPQEAPVIARAYHEIGMEQEFVFLDFQAPPQSLFSWEQEGAQFRFDNLSVNAQTHLWHFGDGRSSTAFEPTHKYVAPGAYTVQLISGNACGFDTTTMEVVVITTSTSTLRSDMPWKLYPNPALDYISLDLPKEPNDEISLQIYDLQGIMLRRIEISSSLDQGRPHTISLRDLPAGSYIARLRSGHQTSHRLFVLTH